MSSFTAPLQVEEIPGTGLWRTLRDLTYYAGSEDSAEAYTVPAGTWTDFASIPRPLWSLVGHPAGPYVAAAVLHDWIYKAAPVSRARADSLFLEAMGVLGVRWSLRWTIYLGVRVGGWVAWAKHRGVSVPEDEPRVEP